MREYTHGAGTRTTNEQGHFGLEMSATVQFVVRYQAASGSELPKNIACRLALSVHRTLVVLRANRARCLVPWQTVGTIQRAAIPSGFSLRNRWIKYCATARSGAVQVLMRRSRGFCSLSQK